MDATGTSSAIPAAARPAPERLPRHRYPWPIVAAAAVVLVATLYSFVLAPTVVSASRDLNAGTAALHRGDYATAVQKLQAAYAADSSSHKIQIAYAEAAFADNQPRLGLRLLAGVKLSNSEYAQLQQYMPVQLDKYFQTAS